MNDVSLNSSENLSVIDEDSHKDNPIQRADSRIDNIALRFNTGKLVWSLVSMPALAPMVRVLMFGAEKYSPNNWKSGLKYTGIMDSMQRHMNAFINGEDNDPESKLSHVGHILCNAMFLSYMFLFRKDMDDRYIDKNLENGKS